MIHSCRSFNRCNILRSAGLSVFLFVSLFVCLSARISKKITRIHFTKIFCTYYTWPWLNMALRTRIVVQSHIDWLWLGPPPMACNTLWTSHFADDVEFSRNGANWPESQTTRLFRRVRQVAAPGAKSAVSDCILWLKEDASCSGRLVVMRRTRVGRLRSETDCESTCYTCTKSISHTDVRSAANASASLRVSTNTCEYDGWRIY